MTATQSNKAPVKAGLFDRLKSGPVICAEGYLFELERRGYLQAGAFVPEAVVENPEVVKRLHEDFVHAGSDVVEAFTYYAHRQKLRVIGRESVLEDINRQALRIARDVAVTTALRGSGTTEIILPRPGFDFADMGQIGPTSRLRRMPF